MLDNDTKRRIDAARDTLVGKVPDPKSQVEQITIALIYKFMADMDNQAESVGGKRSFFAGAFESYRWENLMSPGLGGHEVLRLYTEAVVKMNANPGVPQLFRDIFKNAYLPYRDPETLRGFLKIIDDFQYDHSERLGDAFEYLLSVLGSQGDAGQFRTPRHIIDFMVDIIAPQNNEVILDPACGTAGFLISAWKFIRAANAKGGKPGAALSPDQRRKLARNIFGYDISPDMVRLSLVNMYLHGFAEPHIHEYDTLTSDERWNETADVILANPPFMTPKGGIRPHGRFSIQARRSEVLFVDYIAEHLSAKGRAAVIVPEGIIFQSAGAYKNLRKMLVENYIVAVVSLPAGVFNPYSGVKTSILFMDKSLAKKAHDILFVKVENDGYDLGAQRRPIDKNDLPEAARQVKAHFDAMKTGAVRDLQNPVGALVVAREKVNESADWNLNGELYREVNVVQQSDYPMVTLGEVVLEMKDGGTPSRRKAEYFGGDIHWCVVKDIKREIFTTKENLSLLGLNNSSAKLWPENTVIISLGATIGKVGIARIPLATKQGLSGIVVDENKILPEYLFCVLEYKEKFIQSLATGVTIKEVRPSKLQKFLKFPLPPLNVQREILAEINTYQKIINGARQVVENYTPHISIDPTWPVVKLGEVSDVIAGQSPEGKYYNNKSDGLPFYQGKSEFTEKFLGEPKKWTTKVTKKAQAGDIVMSVRAPVGPVNLVGQEICIGRGLAAIRAQKKIDGSFLFYILKEMESKITGNVGAAFASINRKDVQKLKIPLPSLTVQQKITAEIKAEEKLIAANQILIHTFEQKIKTKIAAVWGE